MTAFIAAPASETSPTGIDRVYKTIFAVGSLLFVITFCHEHDQHPPGAQVPGGVRVTITEPPPSPATPAARPLLKATGEPLRETLPSAGCCWFCMAVGLVTLVVLLTYVFIRGWSAS